MDCKTARLLLDYARVRVSELGPPEAEALERHLAGCLECQQIAQEEREWDDRLAQAMQHVLVPEGLRDRLLHHLARERTVWYRRQLIRGSAVAAGVLLVLGLAWWGLSNRPLTVVSLEEIGITALHQNGAEPEEIQQAFRERGVLTVVPAQFNYACLAYYGLVDFQGHLVPQLVFQRGQALARVYVISGRQFDLEALAEQARADSGGLTVEVLTGPPQIAYLVIYTGGSLTPFLRPAPAT